MSEGHTTEENTMNDYTVTVTAENAVVFCDGCNELDQCIILESDDPDLDPLHLCPNCQ